MARRFGVPLNGDERNAQRQVLGTLAGQAQLKRQVNHLPVAGGKGLSRHQNEDQENQLKSQLPPPVLGGNFKNFSLHQKEDQENHLHNYPSKGLNKDDPIVLDESANDEGIFSQEVRKSITAEDTLDRSYEALTKKLNNFLKDSEEKLEEDKENGTFSTMDCSSNVSLISIDCDSLQKTAHLSDDEASSEIMEHSDCSLAPTSKFTSLDRYDYPEQALNYCLERERSFMPDPYYMSKQFEVNNKMRTILVDWLFDVSDEYNLETETLFLAVNYVDR